MRIRIGIRISTAPPARHTSHLAAPGPPRRMAPRTTRRPRELAVPRASATVILLSPTNEVLMLQRVPSSSSYASAYVFPGGNLDGFHDGKVPAPEAPGRHADGPAYRLGALRECFEETGILLARRGGALLELPLAEREAARRRIHANEVRFVDWVASVGGVPDTAGLVPFTRWITPAAMQKRFTAQIYLYMLPIARSRTPSAHLTPTTDGGIEHTAAVFATPQHLRRQAAARALQLFPPQHYLLHLLGSFVGTDAPSALEEGPLHRAAQRRALLAFLRRVPTATTDAGRGHPTAAIPWADKVISPHRLLVRAADGRSVMALDAPGPELEGSGRGGDAERVVVVRFLKGGGAEEVEVRWREEVLKEERQAAAAAEGEKAKL